MNRPIKFKAWDKQWKQMSAPMELFKNGQSFFFFKGFGTRNCEHTELEVVQYIGYTDDNFNEIYDGDIVECDNSIFEEKVVLKVEMFNENYPDVIMLISEGNHCRIGDVSNGQVTEGVTVIGNIFQNPELIE